MPSTSNNTEKPAESLAQYAYDALKERIVRLYFLPGQALKSAELCALLDLGRTPVHQALQRLRDEGLVEILPRKGVIVRKDSLQMIQNVLESRITVEPALARSAAKRTKAGDVAQIELEHLRAVAVATPSESDLPDVAQYCANDRAFHVVVGSLSGNDMMADFSRKLHERSSRFYYHSMWQSIDIEASNAEHLEIATAISVGDEEGATATMTSHIYTFCEMLKRIEHASDL